MESNRYSPYFDYGDDFIDIYVYQHLKKCALSIYALVCKSVLCPWNCKNVDQFHFRWLGNQLSSSLSAFEIPVWYLQSDCNLLPFHHIKETRMQHCQLSERRLKGMKAVCSWVFLLVSAVQMEVYIACIYTDGDVCWN